MTLEQNIRFLDYWTLFTVIVGVLFLVPRLSPSILFWLQNLLYFGFIDIFHGLVVPLTMDLPQEDKLQEDLPYFYVRPPNMEPRRPVRQVMKAELSLNSEHLSEEYKKEEHQNQVPPLLQSPMSLLMPWSIHPFAGCYQASPPSSLPPSLLPSSHLPPSRLPPSLRPTNFNLPIPVSTNRNTILYYSRLHRP